MKNLSLLLLLTLAGCQAKSEFDITPAQAKTGAIRPPLDLTKLPPGAKKSEKVFHKGDTLPDGSIADGERKMVTVEMNGPGPGQVNETMSLRR